MISVSQTTHPMVTLIIGLSRNRILVTLTGNHYRPTMIYIAMIDLTKYYCRSYIVLIDLSVYFMSIDFFRPKFTVSGENLTICSLLLIPSIVLSFSISFRTSMSHKIFVAAFFFFKESGSLYPQLRAE